MCTAAESTPITERWYPLGKLCGRLIETSGEAATQIWDDLREHSPEVPWAKIRGIRNRLIHAYADVHVELDWQTVVADLPELTRQLEKLFD